MKEPHNAFLLPFIADPPTTTLQRLKGLTTGTLPTLVDLGSSFAGTAIQEDNLLRQLKDADKKIVHLGDDTWTALFPGYFEANLSRAYDSFNVWDLHTVDDGVTENLLPLLKENKKKNWDVIIAHYLGVDHAGHRYGPNHKAMTLKLKQIDGILRDVVSALDKDTLLMVMGDHGMDIKGDHGGESDNEVQAALWMYSKKGAFGRTNPEYNFPPKIAKERFVNQIDLVPTFALLLGLPIPFNNLGKPISEAFIGRKGNNWKNMASVARITAAGIKRYQQAYYTNRGKTRPPGNDIIDALWSSGEKVFTGRQKKEKAREAYAKFDAYADETLKISRNLWARYDVPSMVFGIGILISSVVIMFYVNKDLKEEPQTSDPQLERMEFQNELKNFSENIKSVDSNETMIRTVARNSLVGTLFGIVLGSFIWVLRSGISFIDICLAVGAISGLFSVLCQATRHKIIFSNPLPNTYWSWLAFGFITSQAFGFASNSYTIWEDTILLFFISTFGISAVLSSFRIKIQSDRTLAVYHSLVFTILGWMASFSKLCREEQIPYCKSTYYVTSTSSTSAPWQLAIPVLVAIILPSIIKSFFSSSRSYEGLAPIWISWAFRIGLIFNAIFWTLNAADDGEWFVKVPPLILKHIRVIIAQTIFAVAIGAGSTAFIYAPPCVSISTTTAMNTSSRKTAGSNATLTILGFANVHGTRYFLLLLNILLCILLVQKPMGAGALSIMTWQILALAEILDLNSLSSSPIGPTMLAILGSFHFFKTGHQTTLSSIQWESAFIPLHTIRYPFSPLLVALNSFGAQILAIASVPLLVLWKQNPRKKNIFRSVVRALVCHLSYYAIMAASTSLWAAWLRRHLMLYRIFSPKFMTATVVLLVVEIFGLLIALIGFRLNILSVTEVFGWG